MTEPMDAATFSALWGDESSEARPDASMDAGTKARLRLERARIELEERIALEALGRLRALGFMRQPDEESSDGE